MITSEEVIAPVKGLFGEEKAKVGIDFKAIENKCKDDYKEKVGDYPEWNFQERNKPWPRWIQEGCNKLNEETSKLNKKLKVYKESNVIKIFKIQQKQCPRIDKTRIVFDSWPYSSIV